MKPLPALLALGALAVGAAAALAPEADAAARPNVLIVLMDAQRADRIGAYGYKARATTPNLDKFAAAGMVWEHTFSQDAWTVPCVASLFTSLDPGAHRTQRYQATGRIEMDTLSLGVDAMAEQFQAGGYTTAAFLKSTVIDSSRGFSQGYEHFEVVGGADQAWGRSATQLNDVAIPWLVSQKNAAKPFFAYLHFMDSHSPYKAPEPWYSQYKTGNSQLSGAHVELEKMAKDGTVPTAEDIKRLYSLYDAEIAYFDSEFGRLMAELDKAGLASNTIVVFTADHGEAFYEHAQWFHGNLYQENIHIPAIVRGPGVKAGRMAGYSQQIDIAPTLAELTGVKPGPDWQGRSQVAAMKAGKAVEGVVYSEYASQRMVVDPAGLKLIINDGPVKLYDLKADPTEKNNLASARPQDVQRLRALMDARVAAAKALGEKYPASAPTELSPEQVEALRALGYVE